MSRYRRVGEQPLRPVDHPEHDPSCPCAYDGDDDPSLCLCSCGANDEIQALADEAERGYDLDQIKPVRTLPWVEGEGRGSR